MHLFLPQSKKIVTDFFWLNSPTSTSTASTFHTSPEDFFICIMKEDSLMSAAEIKTIIIKDPSLPFTPPKPKSVLFLPLSRYVLLKNFQFYPPNLCQIAFSIPGIFPFTYTMERLISTVICNTKARGRNFNHSMWRVSETPLIKSYEICSIFHSYTSSFP